MSYENPSEDVHALLQALGLDETSLGLAREEETLLGDPSTFGASPDQTTAPQAINELGEMFRGIQLQAHRIFNVFGTSAPCDVIARHNAAVAAYMQVATAVLADITKQGGQVTQNLYDFDGNLVGTQKGASPVAPAYFEPCKGQAQPVPSAVDGAYYGVPFGNTRMISSIGDVTYSPNMQLGIFPIIAVIAIVVAGITATAIVYVIVHRPQTAVDQVKAQGVWINNYLGCVEGLMRQDPKGGAASADARCRGLTKPPGPDVPAASIGIGLFVLGLVAVGGFLIYRAYQRNPAFQQRVRGMLPMHGYDDDPLFVGESVPGPEPQPRRCVCFG